MDYLKIGKIQAVFFIVIVMLNHLILNLPKNLYVTCGNSILINTIYIVLITLLIVLIIIKLFKRFQGYDILDVSEFLGGKFLKSITGILYLIFFLFVAGLSLRNFMEGLKEVYFSTVPISLLLIIAITVGVIANRYGSNVVARFISIIVPLMMVSLLFILLVSTPDYVLERIFPIFGYGLSETFVSGLTNIHAMSGFCFLYFIMPLLKDTKDFKWVGICSTLIAGIFLILSMSTLLFSFSSILSLYELSPIYLILRALNLGRFFQRPDSIFIFFWILSIMAFIGVMIMWCSLIFKKVSHMKHSKMVVYAFATFIFIVALLPDNLHQIREWQDTIYRYSVIILACILSPLLLLFANLKHKRIHRKKEIGGEKHE